MANAINTSPPYECILWRNDNPSIELVRSALEVVATYLDDSHLIRRVLRCKECGHLYFYEFYEVIDWQEGKDGQYWTWVPVDDEESAGNLTRLTVQQILGYLSIRYDFPKGSDAARGPEWYGREKKPTPEAPDSHLTVT